jgi:hypothetical protein
MRDLIGFGLRHRTEVVHGRLLAAVHEQAEQLCTHVDDSAEELLTSTRQLSVLHQKLRIMAVLKARVVYEAEWSRVAELIGMEEEVARRVYQEAEERWLGGDLEPWLPRPASTSAASVRPVLRWLRGGKHG